MYMVARQDDCIALLRIKNFRLAVNLLELLMHFFKWSWFLETNIFMKFQKTYVLLSLSPNLYYSALVILYI